MHPQKCCELQQSTKISIWEMCAWVFNNWGERSETLPSDHHCNFVCLSVCSVCLSVMDRHDIYIF